MKNTLRFILGNLMAASGLAIFAWLWFAAATTGQGLQLGVNVFGAPLPAMMPIIAGLGLIVFGLVLGYGKNKQDTLSKDIYRL